MTAQDAHAWALLPVDKRQQIIAHFYEQGDDATLDQFLSMVRAPGGYGVYASCGPNYEFAIFGRDSIAVADEVLMLRPELTREIILLLAKLQGLRYHPSSEEEPGKIHHEYRITHFNGERISDAAKKVLAALHPIWGGTAQELCYYGSIDATPKFVSLVGRYCEAYGPDILDEIIIGRDRKARSLRLCVRAAVDWLVNRVLASPWHLLEFRRLNPAGLEHQAWKDSETSYLHVDGGRANADGGIASVEVQGDAYDALIAAQVVAEGDEARSWHELADDIRRQTLDRLWMPQSNFFAMGLDRDEHGNTRQIATLTSNAGALLASGLLQASDAHNVAGVVKVIMSSEFVTPVGVRTRAKKHAGLIPFADYHGSLVSWPHETYTIIRGLRRHGYGAEAQKLEQALLHGVAQAGEFYEFFLVEAGGAVKYHYRQESSDEPTFHAFGAANLPEPGQAWTISAVAATVHQKPH